MAKIWEERRPGYHAYYEEGNRYATFGDVRAFNDDFNLPCQYAAIVYTPPPTGTPLGTFSDIESAKAAVEQECINQSL